MITIKTIKATGDREFLITVRKDGVDHSSKCRFVRTSVVNGSSIEKIEFDSDDFHRFIMMGELNIKDVACAIELL